MSDVGMRFEPSPLLRAMNAERELTETAVKVYGATAGPREAQRMIGYTARENRKTNDILRPMWPEVMAMLLREEVARREKRKAARAELGEIHE